MTFSAAQIAALIGAVIEGNPEVEVQSFGKIEEASEGQLTFLANPKYEDFLYTTQASIVIVAQSLVLRQAIVPTLLRVPDPYSAFASLLSQYQTMLQQQRTGIEEPSFVHPSVVLPDDVYIGAFAYIGKNVRLGQGARIYPHVFIGEDAEVGENSILYAGVKVYQGCKIGRRVVLHAGSVIGSDGFGFAPQPDGNFKKVPQLGIVILEDDVEIGANTTIDRATLGQTIVKQGAKIDNLVQLAHNVEVGRSTVIAAQAGISGSTRIGDGVMIGGQAGIVGHIQIGDGAKVNAQSGVTKSLAPRQAVTGTPAFDYTNALRSQAVSRRLPALEKKLMELEQKLSASNGYPSSND